MSWSLRIPYGDCDMQGVVFNAKYLAYIDDAVDVWFVELLGGDYLGGWEPMVKKATVEWSSPTRYRDVLELTPSVARWGRTSFDVQVDGAVGGRAVFTATIVYVAVSPTAHEPMAVPDDVRARLSVSAPASSTV